MIRIKLRQAKSPRKISKIQQTLGYRITQKDYEYKTFLFPIKTLSLRSIETVMIIGTLLDFYNLFKQVEGVLPVSSSSQWRDKAVLTTGCVAFIISMSYQVNIRQKDSAKGYFEEERIIGGFVYCSTVTNRVF